MGNMTVEAIYRERKEFSEKVFEVASTDLVNMGIQIISYTIKDITDDVGYLAVSFRVYSFAFFARLFKLKRQTHRSMIPNYLTPDVENIPSFIRLRFRLSDRVARPRSSATPEWARPRPAWRPGSRRPGPWSNRWRPS